MTTTARSWLLALVAVICLHATQAQAIAVKSTVYTIFDFTGQCTDCNGSASAQLEVQNYIDGTSLTAGNFVSFTYDGTNLLNPFTITAAQLAAISGSVGPGLPGSFTVDINSNTNNLQFQSSANGSWSVSNALILDDYGSSSSYAAPEPVSMTLLGTALLGLGLARRRAARRG